MTTMSPFSYVQVQTSSGIGLSGATIAYLVAESSTPAAIYSDDDILSPAGTSLTSNGEGYFAVHYLDPLVAYDAVLTINGFSRTYPGLSSSPDAGSDATIVAIAGTVFADGDLIEATGQDTVQATNKNALAIKATGTTTSRTLGARFSERINVKDFGATGNGVTDDLAAFQAAAAAIPAAGAALYIPAGRYVLSAAVTIANPARIYGDGEATVIATSSATANVFTVTGQDVWIEDMTITSSVTRTAGWYIDLTTTAAASRISRVHMASCFEGIRVGSAAAGPSVIWISDVQISSMVTAGVGIRVAALASLMVRGYICNPSGTATAGIKVTSCGDLTLDACELINCTAGLGLQPGSGKVIASVTAQNTFMDSCQYGLFIQPDAGAVVRCSFNRCEFTSSSSQGIFLDLLNGGSVNGINFDDCTANLNVGNGIRINNAGVKNVRWNGGRICQTLNEGFFAIANAGDFSIIGARIGDSDGLAGNGTYGVYIQAGTGANIVVTDNDMRGNTTGPLFDGATGAGKRIHNNLGFLFGSATYDPANIVDGAGVTTTVTVTGAVKGDIVEASFTEDLQGITLTAWVSAADTVSVRFQNESGGALDLASGTLRANVKRIT